MRATSTLKLRTLCARAVARLCVSAVKSHPILLVFLIITLVCVFPTSAQAAECENCVAWPEAFARLLTIAIQNLFLGALKTLVGVLWFFDKAAVYVFDLVIVDGLWDDLRTSLLSSLANLMPGILQNLVGGSSGLLYIAIMLAGITMTLPFLNASRLVRLDQVILWTIVMITLFISGTAGYDLIGAFENLRTSMMQTVMSGQDNDIHAMVTKPMLAGSGDLELMPPSKSQLPTPTDISCHPKAMKPSKLCSSKPGLRRSQKPPWKPKSRSRSAKRWPLPGWRLPSFPPSGAMWPWSLL